MDKLLQVTIPIIVHGEPKGVKQQGGILEFIRREVVDRSACRPTSPSTSTSTSPS